jgi:hypothetical protein
MNSVAMPAANSHVRFDERGRETEPLAKPRWRRALPRLDNPQLFLRKTSLLTPQTLATIPFLFFYADNVMKPGLRTEGIYPQAKERLSPPVTAAISRSPPEI